MQVFDQSRTISSFVGRWTWIGIFHAMTHGVVEQNSNLARRGGDRLGLSDSRREPPVEGTKRGVGPPDVTAASRRSAVARHPVRFVRDDSTLPPEILLFGAGPVTDFDHGCETAHLSHSWRSCWKPTGRLGNEHKLHRLSPAGERGKVSKACKLVVPPRSWLDGEPLARLPIFLHRD